MNESNKSNHYKEAAMDESKEPSLLDLKRFFATPEKPLEMKEFKDFWAACSDEEKEAFREQYKLITAS